VVGQVCVWSERRGNGEATSKRRRSDVEATSKEMRTLRRVFSKSCVSFSVISFPYQIEFMCDDGESSARVTRALSCRICVSRGVRRARDLRALCTAAKDRENERDLTGTIFHSLFVIMVRAMGYVRAKLPSRDF